MNRDPNRDPSRDPSRDPNRDPSRDPSRDSNRDPNRDPTPNLNRLLNGAMKQKVPWEQVHSVNLSIFWSCSTESSCHVLSSVV